MTGSSLTGRIKAIDFKRKINCWYFTGTAARPVIAHCSEGGGMEILSVSNTLNQESAIKLGEVIFWPSKRLLLKQGTSFKLRYKESETLFLLCQRYPNAVSRQEFEKTVWSEGYVIAHTITQTIKSLRTALGDLDRELVVTLPKQGYALNLMPLPCADTASPSEEIHPVSDPLENMDKGEEPNFSPVSQSHRCRVLGVFLGAVLIFCGLFHVGRHLTWAYYEVISSPNQLIKIGLDDKKDASFIKGHTASSYYLLKKVDGRFMACLRYKGGVKCEFEN